VRTVLTLAVTNRWPIQQLDINKCFPKWSFGWRSVYGSASWVWSHRQISCLQITKDGLKQAPKVWFDWLRAGLVKLGFVPSRCDPSLFTLHAHHHTTFLLVYVDDIIIIGSSKSLIQQLIHKLHFEFSLKDLSKLDYFLGIEVHHDASGSLLLSQTKYIRDLLTKAKCQWYSLSSGFQH
jgi:histone deacetylase 1/2